MKKRIISVLLSTLLTLACLACFAYGENTEADNSVDNSPSFTVLSYDQLGNTFHRMTTETVTENGISYLKLTPTADALVPKIDRYGLNLDLSPYNYIKIRYKTSLNNYSIMFEVKNGTSLDSEISLDVPQADIWISHIVPIYTTDISTLDQYHLNVFGKNTANTLQGEEFSIDYLGFFDKYESAYNYNYSPSDYNYSPYDLGNDYIITGIEFCENLDKLNAPHNFFEFSASHDNTILKMSADNTYLSGKIQFKPEEIMGIPLVKQEYNWVKIRLKIEASHDGFTNRAFLLEGYDSFSHLHEIGTMSKDSLGGWLEIVAPIDWVKSKDNHRTIITLQPSRFGPMVEHADIYLDYIGFFRTEFNAYTYQSYNQSYAVITAQQLLDSGAFDPDGNLTIHEALSSDGALVMEFAKDSTVGKLQFNYKIITGDDFARRNFEAIRIRYRHDFSENLTSNCSIREGYSAESTNHVLFPVDSKNDGQWLEYITYPNGAETNQMRDDVNNDISVTTPDGLNTLYDYDAFGNLINTYYLSEEQEPLLVSQNTYNSKGLLETKKHILTQTSFT